MPEIATALRGAVDRNEISAWFQPQLDLASGAIVAVEALCRWTHPELGEVPPAEFIPVAEQGGLIGDIGQFMVEQSIIAAVELSALPHPVQVSVNVSPAQLVTSAFTDRLGARLTALALPVHALTIEITESLGVVDVAAVVQRLDALRSLGLGVAIDDFGIGHASLTQLHRLHATELKIDRSLVVDESPATKALLEHVIETVHGAGLRVVGEGIETPEQLARVKALGCDRAQGFLIARPMPKPALLELLLAA